MSRMRKATSIAHMRDNTMKMTTVSEQTRKNRDKINSKIRVLGEKYYQTKAFLERLNIHRDNLFYIGKHLEEQFKHIKKGLHLQSQTKRMKEALYCWYAENFYDEIFTANAYIFESVPADVVNPQSNTLDQTNVETIDQPLPQPPQKQNITETHTILQPQVFTEEIKLHTDDNAKLAIYQKAKLEDQSYSFEINDVFKEIDNNNQYNYFRYDYPDIYYCQF